MKKMHWNIVFNSIKTLMSIIFPLITFPYASRILGVENLGKVQYCNSIISYFSLFASLGISLYAVREGSKYKGDYEQLSKFSKEILIINTCSLGLSYILFIFFLLFFFKNDYYLLIVISSLSIFFTTYSIEWLYQINEDYVYISVRAFIVQIVSLILLFVFVKDANDYLIYALISIIGSSGSFFFNILNSKKYINLIKKYDLNLVKHLKPIFTIFGISIASSIYMNLDTVMLGSMKGVYEVGIYTAAVKVVTIVKTLVSSCSNVLFPRLSNYLGNGNYVEYKKLLKKGLKYIILLTIPSAIGMSMLSKEIIVLFSGPDFASGDFASKLLSINLIFSIIDGAIYYQILLPFGYEKFASICTIIGAIVNLILNFLLIPSMSYNGAALATLIAEFSVFLGLYYFGNKLVNLNTIIKNIAKYTLLSLPIILWCILIKILFSSILIIIFTSILGSLILYFIALLITKEEIISEITTICLAKITKG